MSTADNQRTEIITKENLTRTFWDNFERILKECDMSKREFAEAVNMNEKTLSSMISRRQCPDIWFMALAKEILKYDCTQLLFHYNERAFTKLLTEKERDILNMIRTGTRKEQNRKLDAITAFLRYANNNDDILGEAIADNTPPSMGTLDNTSTKKRKRTTKNRRPNAGQQTSEHVATEITPTPVIPSPTPVSEQHHPRKRTVVDNPDQTVFPFYEEFVTGNSDN